jgi:hypothetical protein
MQAWLLVSVVLTLGHQGFLVAAIGRKSGKDAFSVGESPLWVVELPAVG